MVLQGLKTMNDFVANKFGSYCKGGLWLAPWIELSDKAREDLAKINEREGAYLEFGIGMEEESSKKEWKRLPDFSAKTAEIMLKNFDYFDIEIDFIHLDGLTEISDSAAESLIQCNVKDISLEGLTEISNAAAESLAKFEGDLHIPDDLQAKVDSFKKG